MDEMQSVFIRNEAEDHNAHNADPSQTQTPPRTQANEREWLVIPDSTGEKDILAFSDGGIVAVSEGIDTQLIIEALAGVSHSLWLSPYTSPKQPGDHNGSTTPKALALQKDPETPPPMMRSGNSSNHKSLSTFQIFPSRRLWVGGDVLETPSRGPKHETTEDASSQTEPETTPPRMYQGGRDKKNGDSMAYFHPEFLDDVELPSDDLVGRRCIFSSKSRTFQSTQGGQWITHWTCRSQWYEEDWTQLDLLLNSDLGHPGGSLLSLPIARLLTDEAELLHPAGERESADKEVQEYVAGLRKRTEMEHSFMNRIQQEFWLLVERTHFNLSHLPRAHAFSNLHAVEELLDANGRYLEAMRKLVKHERESRDIIDRVYPKN
ncbi:hypothetical protein M422DRAFT_46254 [Sphaerobolus stellatus SS14]|uniref:Uncharacterized protein n=1 Tax=Sphaerobolus stellatus (strain SS14) TaxID=990650 RepID=A0A0C9W4C8_SPHS4|nr:hypothetical protein M422DRAFT_46254 [Sphaerobolus stellatus SS14]